MVAGRFRPGAEQVFPDARLAVYSTWAEQRSRTRPAERYDNYEAILDYGCLALDAKLGKNII